MSRTRKKVAEEDATEAQAEVEATQTDPEVEAVIEAEPEVEPQTGPEVAVEPEPEIAPQIEVAVEPEPEALDQSVGELEAALLEAAPRISLEQFNASYRGGRMTPFQCAALSNVVGTYDRAADEWEKSRAAILGG